MCPSIEICLISHDEIEVMRLGQECHRMSDIVPTAGYRIRGYMRSIGLIPSDINPDHLVKGASVAFDLL